MPFDMLATRRCAMDELAAIDRDLRRIENAEGLTFDGPTGIAEQGRQDALSELRPYLARFSHHGWDPITAWHTGIGTSGYRVELAHIAVDDAVLELLHWCTLRAFYRAAASRRGKQNEDAPQIGGTAEVQKALAVLAQTGVPLSRDNGTTIYKREPLRSMD